MTGSRLRPAAGQKSKDMNPASTEAPAEALPMGMIEIPINVSGFSHATPQENTIGSSLDNMHHKLHLVLRDLLKKNGQSARKAAKACGVPLSTFNGYLKPDRHQIDPNHLLAMAKYFGVSLDYLLSGHQSNPKIDSLPTKKLFSRWVKLTIEGVADEDDFDFLKGGKK
ncbi:MAG: helix-turn-helix transcriptional regulator [Bdellovibrionales bacterium]|nr:helix-turn-helix transcriptional regulator [Bdellovibrionales bacterium]